MAKRYTNEQIKEAIAYWKNKLMDLNEDTLEGGEDSDTSDKDSKSKDDELDDESDDEPDELKVEEADDPTPFSAWNTNTRLVRAHKFAVRKTIEKLNAKLLNKAKLGDEAVTIENTLVDDDDGTGNFKSGNTMIVTLRVTVDEAHVKGFRKFMAVILKESTFNDIESEYGRIDEGIFSTIANAFKAGAKSAGESIDRANAELEKRIGLAGLREYFLQLCGKAVAAKLRRVEPGIEKDDNGKTAAFVYKAAVTIK